MQQAPQLVLTCASPLRAVLLQALLACTALAHPTPRVVQITAERKKWPKFGHAAKSNEGVTMQSVDEIMFERTNLPKKAELDSKPENAMVRFLHLDCFKHCQAAGCGQARQCKLDTLLLTEHVGRAAATLRGALRAELKCASMCQCSPHLCTNLLSVMAQRAG